MKRQLNQALSLYEKYSSTDQDSRQYNSFVDVRRRLNNCGSNDTAAEILWRIMAVKMKSGLDYREFPRSYGLGSALVKTNRLLDARQIFLEDYDRSFELGDHEYNENDLKDIRELK